MFSCSADSNVLQEELNVRCGAAEKACHIIGVDTSYSLEPDEMAQLVVEGERAWQALGQVSMSLLREKKFIKYRRPLYIVQAMNIGDELTHKNICSIRPRLGFPLKYLEHFRLKSETSY